MGRNTFISTALHAVILLWVIVAFPSAKVDSAPPDGSGERIMTEGFHNEGPTWAPNGRVLMFFRESPGAAGGPKLYTIDLTGYHERQVATPAFGSGPAWSPLIN